MKLIGAGLPRTGTLSQKVGLEVAGQGPCYHMVNILANLDLVPQWRRAVDGDGQWDEIFDGFEATVDWPGSFFYKELLEVYPDAKVLLSTRESESWARSMRETIWGVIYGKNVIRYLSDARCEIDPKWDGYIDLMKEMWQRSGLMEGVDTSEQFMAEAMERYEEEVKATVPADRLLGCSRSRSGEPRPAKSPRAPRPRAARARNPWARPQARATGRRASSPADRCASGPCESSWAAEVVTAWSTAADCCCSSAPARYWTARPKWSVRWWSALPSS